MINLTFPTSTFDTAAHFAFETETKRFGEVKTERHEGYLFRDDTDGHQNRRGGRPVALVLTHPPTLSPAAPTRLRRPGRPTSHPGACGRVAG